MKWRTIETEEVVWEGAKAEQARFDKLQADVKNGKVRLVDVSQSRSRLSQCLVLSLSWLLRLILILLR